MAEEQERQQAPPQNPDKKCQICREIGEEYNSKHFFLSSTDFIMETVCPDGKSKEQKKKLKQEKVSDFLKIINAMLNEGHGILCVHTSTPHLLGLFDEAVNKRMLSLIPDDTLFDDNFERHFKDKEHVIFRVRPRRRPFSTCCFNTKLSTDTGLVDPTPGQMRYFLKKQSETHPDQQDSEIPEQDTTLIFTEGEEVKVSIGNTDIVFQESIRTQAKQMPQTSEGDRKKWSYGNILRFFEEENRLQKYITAFSKLKTGGSIFWGVSEQKEENKNWTEMNMTPKQTQLLQSFGQPALKLYKDKKQEHVYHIASESQVPTTGGQKTGEFRCQGIHPEGLDVNDFANRLIRDMKIKMLWVDRATILDPSKETSDDVSNHIKVKFHPVRTSQGLDTNKKVIEVCVKRYGGVSFTDPLGPEAYYFKRLTEDGPGPIDRTDIKLWLRKNTSGFQARSKDQEILEEGGGAGPSTLPRRDHE